MNNQDKKRLTIVYIGDGKGKTSAAVGLAVRAIGTGMRVLFLQFVKGNWQSGEISILEKLPNITVKVLGKGFVGILDDQKPLVEHIKAALDALEQSKKALISGVFDLVILDEALSAIESKLLSVDDIVSLIKAKPEQVHLCLTGHKRIKRLIDLADLVTEMKMIKHPYYKGILAQKGIDF
jgi:cob(I)alamin adenosyltransferase